MIIAITGATGLVGSALVKKFAAEGHHVRALYRSAAPPAWLAAMGTRVTPLQADVLDVLALQEAFSGADYVVHTAAVVSFSPKDKSELFKVNVEGTANVVNECLHAGIKKLCFISSVAALGRPTTAHQEPDATFEVDETQKWEESPLNSNYAQSKYQAETHVWRGEAEGLPVIVVNPSVILGEGNWQRSSTQLFKYVYDQNLYYTEGFLNYVDLQDVIAAVYQLTLHQTLAGQRFILNGGTISYKDFFEKVAVAFGRQPPKRKISRSMAEIIWRVEAVRSFITGSKPLITQETAKTARTRFIYQSDAIKKALGFSFTPLDETIRRVANYLLSKGL